MTDKILALTTCSSMEEANRMAEALVESKLAACVNILPAVQSVYRWKDEVQSAEELLLIIKSRRELFPALAESVRQLHSYEVPELVAIPVVDGLVSYLDWIDRETGHG